MLDPLPVSAAHLPETIPQYEAKALTQGGVLAHIELHGQIYALRITRSGKLILTK